MSNKTFLRIVKKSLGILSRDEFIELIANFKKTISEIKESDVLMSFFEDLQELFDSTDKSFTDMERTLYLRDSSLAISSREMTVLNGEIESQARRQAAILERLQSTVSLLSQVEKTEIGSRNIEMEKLVEMVDFLVRTKMDSAKLQKVLYEEGLKVCSVLSFRNLEIQLQSSLSRLTGTQIGFEIFFCGSLFDGKDKIEFYQCNDKNIPLDEKRLSLVKLKNQFHYLNIDSPKGNGTLAVIQLSMKNSQTKDEIDLCLSHISPLIPSIASTLENIRLLQEEKRKQFMESELDTIRLVQQTLLPNTIPVIASGNIEISGYYQSATECSGDWWTYFQLTDGRHIILVGDVTGHGTGSAMVCAVIKGYCDSFRDRQHLPMSQLLEELNQVVWRMAKESGRAMTMAAVALDDRNNKATFSNAGHPFPILVQGFGSETVSSQLMSSGPILGIEKQSKYKEIAFNFCPGDRLLLYSDGLTESTNSEELMYGENRLRRLMKNLDGENSAAELNRLVIQDVVKFSVGESFKDDLTTVIVRHLVKKAAVVEREA